LENLQTPDPSKSPQLVMPLVSVIMPAYNAVKTIGESIDSVLGQTYTNWELIVIDDASTDETISIITIYQSKDDRIKLMALSKNGWMANARNHGIATARGEYLAFLDSDDIWMKDKLSEQVNFHIQHPEIIISHTDFDMFSINGIKKRPFKNIIGLKYRKDGNMIPTLYCKNSIGTLTIMVKRDAVLAANCFDIDMRGPEDQDLWIRLAENGGLFGYIDKKLALYRLSEGSVAHNIGRYKRAFKKLLEKHKASAMQYNVYNLALSNYYRYFGLFYSSKKQYRLAMMYLCASIKNESYLPDQILTIGFYILCVLRYYIGGFKK